jgi:DNA polymerase-3 subunit chi
MACACSTGWSPTTTKTSDARRHRESVTEVRFYHLQRARLEEVLPVILERCHQRGERVLVLAGSTERVEALASLLWTYKPDSFLPHGTPRDGEAARQPIFLATPGDAGGDDNPNGAPVLILSDGARHPRIGGFKLVCELFDGHDEAAVAAARAQWRSCKEAGHAVIYYQQADSGKWQETARA